MSNILHLAIPAGDLSIAKTFYCDLLGCKEGNSEEGHWLDIDFWGNELTLHQSTEKLTGTRHDVDMGAVVVPHFGIHMPDHEFQALKARIEKSGLAYLDAPYRRFVGTEFEQETFFIEDPNGNVLEMKTMMDPAVLFKAAPGTTG
ncbi:MAG: extradiol dioxygenase family protein [Psychromonas sp.]|jgi:extradiol dioxygenase family protein